MATKVWATITPAGRERQREAEPAVEVLADEAAAAERVEQRDAADDRAAAPSTACRALAPAPGPGTRPGPAARRAGRRRATASAVAHSEQHSDRRSAVSALSRGEDRPGVAPRRLPQQPDERQREEGDGDDGQDERRRRGGAPGRPGGGAATGRRRRRGRHGAPEAVLRQDRLPVGAEQEVDERLVDARWFVDVLTLAIGYLATTLMSSGMSTACGLVAGGGRRR